MHKMNNEALTSIQATSLVAIGQQQKWFHDI